jgi:hypothetical protein
MRGGQESVEGIIGIDYLGLIRPIVFSFSVTVTPQRN